MDINWDIPDIGEITIAIKQQKNGKAAGPDDIPPEAIKDAEEKSLTEEYFTHCSGIFGIRRRYHQTGRRDT